MNHKVTIQELIKSQGRLVCRSFHGHFWCLHPPKAYTKTLRFIGTHALYMYPKLVFIWLS